ncbi:hypothetical protein ACOMHN_009914 [Nucella lapillus]
MAADSSSVHYCSRLGSNFGEGGGKLHSVAGTVIVLQAQLYHPPSVWLLAAAGTVQASVPCRSVGSTRRKPGGEGSQVGLSPNSHASSSPSCDSATNGLLLPVCHTTTPRQHRRHKDVCYKFCDVSQYFLWAAGGLAGEYASEQEKTVIMVTSSPPSSSSADIQATGDGSGGDRAPE